jgi:hypothetical protein
MSFAVTNGNQNNESQDSRGDSRLHSLLDDQDHQQCSQGNRRALLSEKLDSLRGKIQEIQQDSWMYVKSKSKSGSVSLSNVSSTDPEEL